MISISKKQINTLLIVLFIILGIALVYFIATTVLKWLLPFIFAYALAYITDPIVTFLEKKLKVPRKLASASVILLALLLMASLLFFVIYRIIYEIKELAIQLPELLDMLSEHISNLFDKGVTLYLNLPLEVSQFVDTVLSGVASNLTSLLKPLTGATTKSAYLFVKSLPSLLIFTIVLFLSTYFISSDKEKISEFLHKQIPLQWTRRVKTIKKDLFFALLGYIRAQLILMGITFVIITIGLLIIGVNYAILLGLLISLIDALPVLGTGTILIPWGVFSLLSGNYLLGISLLALYGIVLLVRQILEPKIVGGQIGLYPLVTLMSMYVGLKLFGLIGMVFGPIIVLILRNLQKAGVFKLWND